MVSAAESFAHRRVRLGSVEPARVVLLKQLDPLIVIVSLFACQLAYGNPITTTSGVFGLLAYVVASQLFEWLDGVEAGASMQSWSSFSRGYSRLLVQWAAVVAVLLFVAFAFKVSALLSRRVFLTWSTVTPVALALTQSLRQRARERLPAASFVIIGVNEVGLELARRLPGKGFMGYFDFRSADRVGPLLDTERLAGHCHEVAQFVRTHEVKIVYIALPLSNVPRMTALINELRDTTASIYFVPDAFAFDLIQGRLVEINGMPALSVCDTPFHGMDAVLKRAMDLTLSGLVLLITWPVMLLIAIGIKLSSRGPVLFRQRRYGLDGKEIVVYKFRSMTVCEDGDKVTQATKDDIRVTALGRLLRKTSLDELPQIFNVLQGKMSLVGPRPHAVAHNEQYRKLISGYMLRHKVRPGITGLAQINGLRGETETVEKMSERVRYDLEYLRHWSPWLDLKILFMTVLVVLHDRNAY